MVRAVCLSTTVLLAALCAVPASAAPAPDIDPIDVANVVGDIVVTGARLNESAAATGLDLSLRETPQSVTVVDRQRIDDFALTNVNDLLEQTVGVTVQRNETDRTDYTARGFAITNFQVDGIGLPLLGAIDGDLDTILYDRVEVVRGANAIMTGIGNPSATINYVRKRPTRELAVIASGYAGSFDQWRLEGDVSAPLVTNGALRARVIGAHEERDSWLDYNKVNRDVAAGLLAYDVTPALTATAGYSRQSNRARGILWGALPLIYSDGTRIDYPRSASTAAPWTFVNTVNESAFGELAWRLSGDWSARGIFTYNHATSQQRRLYATGTPDPATGLGVVGFAGYYPTEDHQYLIDGYASGGVTLFGRRHQLAFGVSQGWLRRAGFEADPGVVIDYPDIRKLASFFPPEPDFPVAEQREDERDRLTRVYGAMHLNLTDRLKGVAGVSSAWIRTRGVSYGSDLTRDDSKVSPYAGLLFDLDRHVTLYASYTDIYAPQAQVDVNVRRLDPAKGTSIEGGIKGSWLDNRLYASAALFRAKQRGLANYVDTFDGTNGPLGVDYYEGRDTTSKGFELEVAGRVTGRWFVSGGFTHLAIHDDEGGAAQRFIPRDQAKLVATYIVPHWRDLKLGGQFRYQSPVRASDDSAGLPIEQGGYAVVDLLAGIRVADHVEASVNVRNVGGAKYLNSLEWGQAYYAAPRSVLGTVRVVY